jgi:hypothetical protein
MASILVPECGIPNVIVIGVPDTAALLRVLAKLAAYQIPHYAWTEPDNDFGLTAIATGPIDDEQRKVLSNYRLWRVDRGGLSGSLPDTRTTGAISSEKERLSLQQRVAG